MLSVVIAPAGAGGAATVPVELLELAFQVVLIASVSSGHERVLLWTSNGTWRREPS